MIWLWLSLLGIATILEIAVRRARRREDPLDDQVYLNSAAVDNLQSGVAWVRPDGNIGFVNHAFTSVMEVARGDIMGRNWYEAFVGADRVRIEEVYRQMQIAGLASVEITGSRGSKAPLDLLLVAVYDAKKHFRGHHCILGDRGRERALEERLRQLTQATAKKAVSNAASETPVEVGA